MRPSTHAAWLSPLALTCILALFTQLAGCTFHNARGSTVPFEPDILRVRSTEFYHERLIDLPLRIDPLRWHLNASEPGGQPVALRELHLLRDKTQKFGGAKQRDVLLAVLDNKRMYSFSARDFTVNWKGNLVKRTRFDPLLTEHSIFFVDEHGEFQQFNRFRGELRNASRFGIGRRPSTVPTANDSHIIIPTSHQSSVQGWGDASGAKTIETAPQNWTYPNRSSGTDVDFSVVSLQPIADVGTIYFVGNNNYLYGLDSQTGDLRFKTDLGRESIIRTPPVLKDDVIYAGSSSQLFAVSRTGEVLWTFTTSGPVDGQIFAMDNKVYFNTLKIVSKGTVGGKYRDLDLGRTTQDPRGMDIELIPDEMLSVGFSRQGVAMYNPDGLTADNLHPKRVDEDGNVIRGIDVIKGPSKADWTLPNQGQRILLKTSKYLYVLFEEWEIPYSADQQASLRTAGKVIKDSELQVARKKILQVLDINTGKVVERGGDIWSWNVSLFPFIIGSMDETDRALYFGTRDGHIFKAFAID